MECDSVLPFRKYYEGLTTHSQNSNLQRDKKTVSCFIQLVGIWKHPKSKANLNYVEFRQMNIHDPFDF